MPCHDPEIVMRCGEHRGWSVFRAAAAAIGGHGVLIAGPSGAGKTTVLTALTAHRRADIMGSDRVLVTEGAVSMIGVPISVRVADGALSALAHGPTPGAGRRIKLYWRIHQLANATLSADPDVRHRTLAHFS